MGTESQDTQEENMTTEEVNSEKGTGTDQTKTVRTFTQDELNKVVAKEKAAWKRTQDKASEDHETIVGGLRKDVERRDEIITKQIDLLSKDLDLDEETMELLNGLDVLARYDWILKKVEKAGKKEIKPRVPSGQAETNNPAFVRTNIV